MDDRGFKVQDRRRFSAEGELKAEYRDEDQPGAADQRTESDTSSQQHASDAARPREASSAGSATQAPEINFSSFIVGLSTEALAVLGELPEPVTGERKQDLRAAQQIIDIIGILRDKTKGNLDHNEEALLEGILFDLRMKYVQIKGRPAH